MVEVRIIRNEQERVLDGYKKRNLKEDQLALVPEIIVLDDLRKTTQATLDQRLARINEVSREIGQLMKSGAQDQTISLKAEVASLKEETKSMESKLQDIESNIESKLLQLPNVPHKLVPEGLTPEDNFIYKAWDKPMPDLPPNPLMHWELAKKYNLFDMELGVKITGSGFILYRNQGAKLQRALINFFLDEATKAGYEEVQTPYMVNAESARATGQLPDKEAQMYYMEKDDLYMIPTAEVPVTNIYRDVILKEQDFPITMTGYSPCFRREAGSYGAHVKGLNRVHQFDKVEIVRIEHPDQSEEALEGMIAHVEGLLIKLELPYRILRLCGGDMGFASAITYDFEVFSAAQQRWLEVSSVSNFETFQSNRMKLRFKTDKGEMRYAHTLNGSALALARIVASILENHQTSDGIRIPLALQSYFGKEMIS
ncbi:MAG: serine--tRNA ligase [Saprospiraceae bacterium]|uniref:Serine--tRNA ligase n=1 Tax=Candidatus Defluviibacterium haderslevense TaxID=2981993 RepID=A0A9D7S8T4_9BACT|nr:serine--tRNA ligase [Candidatus Defluviibacterium haderslevense]MBL0236227.1 serine--tRNA ligase [Candidatus Defluviibacterium haderslevense]